MHEACVWEAIPAELDESLMDSVQNTKSSRVHTFRGACCASIDCTPSWRQKHAFRFFFFGLTILDLDFDTTSRLVLRFHLIVRFVVLLPLSGPVACCVLTSAIPYSFQETPPPS